MREAALLVWLIPIPTSSQSRTPCTAVTHLVLGPRGRRMIEPSILMLREGDPCFEYRHQLESPMADPSHYCIGAYETD